MARMLAAFGGTFTGVFSALIVASCPPEYAARKAAETAEAVDADFNDPSGVVMPLSIEKNEKYVAIVSYISRSGKRYIFRFVEGWYGHSFEFDEESRLLDEFETIAAEVV